MSTHRKRFSLDIKWNRKPFDVALKCELLNYFWFICLCFSRCKVPECDKSIGGFSEPWLRYAVPFKNNRPEKCVRYNYNNTRAIDTSSGSEQCLASIFNQSDVIKCNDFIFKTDEHRIMKEVNRMCFSKLILLRTETNKCLPKMALARTTH